MPSLGYLKRWRRSAPRSGGGAASEEWEALERELSDREDAEDADAVVVGTAAAAPPPKAPPKEKPDGEALDSDSGDEDLQPFALLRLRIRPASAAFWVRQRLGQGAPRARAPRRAPGVTGRLPTHPARGSRADVVQ